MGIRLDEFIMMVLFNFSVEWSWEPLLCNSIVIVNHNRRNSVTKWMLKRIYMKRHIIVIYWCCLCKKSGVSIDHLLLHCEWASALWNSIFGLFGLVWAMPHRVRYPLAYWRGKCGNPLSEALWKMIPLCLMWCIWWERNYQSIEDGEKMVVELKAFFFNSPHFMLA